MDAIDRGLWFYRVYYIRRWRRSLTRKKTAFPDLYDFDGMEHFNSLGEMTDHFVRHYTEYPNLQTYLNGYALTGNRLAGLCVPSTMLLSEDDPVIPIDGFDEVAATGSLRLERVPFGGHCGFIDGYGSRTWLNDYFLDAFESAELASNLRQRAS
jgi:predicted alpha/beta-fold hydrolase